MSLLCFRNTKMTLTLETNQFGVLQKFTTLTVLSADIFGINWTLKVIPNQSGSNSIQVNSHDWYVRRSRISNNPNAFPREIHVFLPAGGVKRWTGKISDTFDIFGKIWDVQTARCSDEYFYILLIFLPSLKVPYSDLVFGVRSVPDSADNLSIWDDMCM